MTIRKLAVNTFVAAVCLAIISLAQIPVHAACWALFNSNCSCQNNYIALNGCSTNNPNGTCELRGCDANFDCNCAFVARNSGNAISQVVSTTRGNTEFYVDRQVNCYTIYTCQVSCIPDPINSCDNDGSPGVLTCPSYQLNTTGCGS